MRYWDEIEIGEKYTTPSRTITEADVVMFGTLTGDFSPLHMDEEVAKSTVYGGRIAQGLMGLSYMEGMKLQTHFPVATMGSLGWTIRFCAPIRIGDTLTCHFEVAEKRETKKPDRGILVVAVQLLNQRGEVVQEGQHTRMIKRRVDASPAA